MGDTTIDNQVVEDQVQDDQTDDSQVSDDSSDSQDQGVQYTDKGTKLDPNPQSALHQQLANERRMRQQYEKVLSDKEMFLKYAEQSGYTKQEAKEAAKEIFSPDKFKTVEDVASAFNELSGKYAQEIESLKKQLSGIDSERRVNQAATRLDLDIRSAKEKYPELNPKSPNYDLELDKEIFKLYSELDADPTTGNLRGEIPLMKVVDRVMRAAGRAKKAASKEAQTQVVTKQSGRVVTSQKSSSKEASDSDLSPADAISKRIASLYK